MVLNVYKSNDRVFNNVFLYQGFFSLLATGVWYTITSKFRIIRCKKMLKMSLPIAFFFFNYPCRGIAQQYVASRANTDREMHVRKDNYMDYKIELRNKKIID